LSRNPLKLEKPGISLRCRSSHRTREELKILSGKEAMLKRNFYSMEDGQGSEIERDPRIQCRSSLLMSSKIEPCMLLPFSISSCSFWGTKCDHCSMHQGSTTRGRECYSSIYQGLVCGFRKYPLDGLVCRVYAVKLYKRIAGVERAKVRQARALNEDWHLLFLQRSSTVLVAPSLNFSMARVSNKTEW